MKEASDDKHTLYCSFCGKSQHQVKKLIAGPTVFICNECIHLCMDIIAEGEDRADIYADGLREFIHLLDDDRKSMLARDTFGMSFEELGNSTVGTLLGKLSGMIDAVRGMPQEAARLKNEIEDTNGTIATLFEKRKGLMEQLEALKKK